MAKPIVFLIDKETHSLMLSYDVLSEEFGNRLQVQTFSECSEALDFYQTSEGVAERTIGVIFDPKDQHINGLNLIQSMLQRNYGIKSLLMTKSISTDDLSEIINKTGLDYLLSKPLDIKQLKEKVREIFLTYERSRKTTRNITQTSNYKERYSRLLQTVNDIIYELDENLHLVLVEGDVEKLGYNEEILTQRGQTIHDFVHPEDLPLLIKNYKVNQHGKTTLFQVRLKTAGGSYRWAEVSSYPLSDGSTYKGTFGTIQLIHTRKMAESALRKSQDRLKETNMRLQFAFEASNEGYWDQDMITGQTFYSPQYYTLLGYRPGEFQANQQNWVTMVHPDDRPYIVEQVDLLLKGEVPKIESIMRMKAKDGSWKWIMERAIPVDFFEDGKPCRIIGTHMDVSQLKETELELIKAKQQAEEATRLKTSFLANMSHEIRTPLNSIVGFSNMLTRQDISDEKREQFMEIIQSNTEHLLTLINDILDISRIQSGQMSIDCRPVTVTDFLKSVFDSYRVIQKRKELKHIELKLHLPELKQTAVVMADEIRLKQVLTNLIDNAFKFTPTGTITIGFEQPNESDIYFFVKDTGIGIAPENHQVIFDRFRQEENGHKRHFGGTGLGLAITQSLVDMMNGTIGVESAKDRGSEFFIILPAAKK